MSTQGPHYHGHRQRLRERFIKMSLRGHFRITEMAPDLEEYEGMYPLIL